MFEELKMMGYSQDIYISGYFDEWKNKMNNI